MNILTGKTVIKRIYELLEKILNPTDLQNYSIPVDSQNDTDTKRVPLDKLKIALTAQGIFDDRGLYDASVNVFPSTGGTGTAGTILRGNVWTISVAGTLGGIAVIKDQEIRALIDNPGQTLSNWHISFASGEIDNVIVDYTVPAPVSSVLITLDKSGNPLDINEGDRLIFIINADFDTTLNRLYIKLNNLSGAEYVSGTALVVFIFPLNQNSYAHNCELNMFLVNGGVQGSSKYNYKTSLTPAPYGTWSNSQAHFMSLPGTVINSITSIEIFSTIPAGTLIRILKY